MGYSLFFWITTFLTPPSLEQPDILVFIVYLLACALCMHLSHRQEWWRYALLGLVLGLGYLVKSVMFPLGFVFLFALFLPESSMARVSAAYSCYRRLCRCKPPILPGTFAKQGTIYIWRCRDAGLQARDGLRG